MKDRVYATVSAAVFAVVATAHLARLFLGVPVSVGGVGIPVWLSLLGFSCAGALSVWGFTATHIGGNK